MKWIAACCSALIAAQPLSAADGELPSPEETVRKPYTEHIAGKGVIDDEGQQDRWVFMFGEDLVKALKADGRGFDPLLFAQDAEIKDLKVRQIDDDGKGNTLVSVSFTNFGETTRLVVALHATDHAHRIENIIQPATGIDLIHDLAGAHD